MPGLICLDVDGTLSDRFRSISAPGVAEAVDRLRSIAPVRLVTNATSLSHRRLAAMLGELGLLTDPADLVTPAVSARAVLGSRGHDAGILLADGRAREDFGWFRHDPEGAAVVVASESHERTLADLQPAFRLLLDGAAFYTLQRNRYYRQGRELVTDLGPVEAFLAYAANRQAENLGKPSPLLFRALADQAGCALDEVVMVGDDAEFDASGSVRLGMRGILVRTGKYRDGDETRFSPPPTAVLDSVAALPDWIAAHALR